MKLFVPFLNHMIRSGTLTVTDADGVRHVFAGCDKGGAASIRFHDRRLHWRLVTRPSLAVGEGYMDGGLTLEDGTTLEDFLTLILRNESAASRRGLYGAVGKAVRAIGRLMHFNPLGRARRNVAHHYDLGEDLFDLFLDAKRQYSCAYFAAPEDSLDQAQENKLAHIARKLLLKPGQRVLDIGSGWGGLGLHLADTAEVNVTGITLSQEQLAHSNRLAKARGKDHACRFVLRDYRRENATYDRIVSIGMFEHVGVRHYGAFFRKAARLLADDGVMLLHSIGAVDRPGPVPAWIDRYIFPGSYVPTLSEVVPAAEKAGLLITDLEVLRLHYAETLRHWRRRFLANRDKAKALYDERFCRMWEFYLLSCETAFRIGDLMVFQLQLAKRQDAVPLTRDYLYAGGPAEAVEHRRLAS